MEEEAEKLKELQNEVEKQMNLSPPPSKFVSVSLFICGRVECLRWQEKDAGEWSVSCSRRRALQSSICTGKNSAALKTSKYQLHLVEGDRDHYVLLASGWSFQLYKLLVYVKQSCTE